MASGVTERETVGGGRRRAAKKARPSPRRLAYLVALTLGILACGAAWVFLVRAAIDFGQVAREGETFAWGICAGATVGAALCLLLVFVLVARGWATLGLRSADRPRRSPGGRRAR